MTTRTERLLRREAYCRTLGWGGSYAVEHCPAGRCPRCATPLIRTTVHQDALIRHGGYGATVTVTRDGCPRCVWSTVTDTGETRPPR